MDYTKNDELNAFFRDDYDFESYVQNRNDDSSDIEDIYESIKSGSTDNIDKSKQTLKTFLESDNADVKSMINMGKNDEFLRFVSTKILTKLYDKIVNGAMKQQHESEKKKPEERTESEQRKLNQMAFRMGIEIAREMEKGDSKESFQALCEIKKTVETADIDNQNGSNSSIPLETMIKIAKDSKSMLAKIIKMAGHFQGTFSHKIRTSTKGYEILTGIGFGNELDSVLPEEIMYLDDEDFQDLKNLDLINQQLQQYQFKGNQPQTSGPIVCCIDESGSMHGDRIIKAKAYCFGLYQKAKAENREFKILRFGSVGNCIETQINCANDLIQVSQEFMDDGGTDYETVLNKAIGIIDSDVQYKKADIIMITDDGCWLDNDYLKKFNDFKSRTETKLIVMNIMDYPRGNISKIADEEIIGHNFDELVNRS